VLSKGGFDMDFKQFKEKSDRLLLQTEILLATFGITLFLLSIFAVCFMPMHPALAGTVVAAGVICLMATIIYCLRIEQIAGYYECPRCGHRYVPKFRSICFCFNFGRTRKLKCEHCGRTSWHEKVLSLDENN
jgi:DNA-directed RNA polymerase subunit RPC12/RpoP